MKSLSSPNIPSYSNKCISRCHHQFNCEDCPNSEAKIEATRKFDRTFLSIIGVLFTVFTILCILEMNH